MRRQDHGRRPLHHGEVGYPCAPNQVAMKMEVEVEVSLVGDDTYSRVVLVNVPLKGEGGKRYINLVLNLVKEIKKEDEEEVKGLPSCVRTKEVGKGGLVSRNLRK
jgi:hypothetical protein